MVLQHCWVKKEKKIKTLSEIGFNVGTSYARSRALVTSFV